MFLVQLPKRKRRGVDVFLICHGVHLHAVIMQNLHIRFEIQQSK